ncbi:Cu(I)-responsive transcriptional regulator [Ferrimonas sp.]|uniref:Cu(I)-responsive transcriptional regulator n=1 Tax=Ferrimonas sp. TaxID=2080861 RepID=UPI003A8DAD88
MKISAIAKAAGLTVKTIRYYESVGLISPPQRSDNGYRSYDETQIPGLRLIRRARTAGFSVAECKELLGLFNNQSRHSHDVYETVNSKILQIDQKVKELIQIRTALAGLAGTCANDKTPDCAILDSLAAPDDELPID